MCFLISCIIVANIVLLVILVHHADTYPQYFGDIPLETYLQSFCSESSTADKSVYVINNLRIEGSNSSIYLTSSRHRIYYSDLHIYLNALNCAHLYHDSQSTAQLMESTLRRRVFLKSKEVLFLFDFTANELNQTQFNSILFELSRFYFHCSKCQPFVVLLNLSLQTILDWSSHSTKHVSSQVRLILLPKVRTTNQSIHINPIVNGCLREQGVALVPSQKIDYDILKIPFNKCNLNATLLNVSVNHWLPFCDLQIEPNRTLTMRSSMESELLIGLQRQYNFRANLIDSNGSWGILVNGVWSGVIGQVYYGKTAFGLCDITRTTERLDYVDFSNHIFIEEFSFMSQSAGLMPRDWIVLKPFSKMIWAILVCFFVLIALVINFSIIPNKFVIIKLFGICINQSIHAIRTEQKSSTRIIYAIWMLSALIFTNLYSSSFYSFLTVPEYASSIDTVHDLEMAAKTDKYRILALEESSYLSQFTNADPENRFYNIIGQNINKTKQMTSFLIKSSEDQFTFVEQDPNYIAIMDRRHFYEKRSSESLKQLHIGSENVANYYTGMALPKRSPLTKPFNVIICRMQEMGLFQYWVHRSKSETSTDNFQSNKNSIKIVALNDVKSIFIIWIIGNCTALMCFLAEKCIHAYKVQKFVK